MNYGLSQRAVEAHLQLVHGQGRRESVWRRYITSEARTESSAMAPHWAAGTRHSSHTCSCTHLHRGAQRLDRGKLRILETMRLALCLLELCTHQALHCKYRLTRVRKSLTEEPNIFSAYCSTEPSQLKTWWKSNGRRATAFPLCLIITTLFLHRIIKY